LQKLSQFNADLQSILVHVTLWRISRTLTNIEDWIFRTAPSQVWFKHTLLCYSWSKCTWFLKIFRYVMCNSSSRGHSLKIRKQFSRVNCRAFSFANCCVDVWNSLNNEVVFASSLTNLNSRMLILVFFLRYYGWCKLSDILTLHFFSSGFYCICCC